MTQYVRFTLDPAAPPTLTDANGARYGILEDGAIRPVRSLFAPEPDGAVIPVEQVKLLPAASPSKIVCVGRNYAEHAKELGNDIPTEPLIFLKPPSSLVADGDDVVYPKLSSNLHYEGELGLIISKRARNVKAEDWRDYVWGYTCVNDVTARDLQRKDGQWTRGKGFDTFCPTGRWAVPIKEVDFDSLRVQTWLDDKCVQDAPVTNMIFSPGAILAYVTQFLTLEPGDLIATGTPEGVGPMQVGSKVRVVVPGVGQVRPDVQVREQERLLGDPADPALPRGHERAPVLPRLSARPDGPLRAAFDAGQHTQQRRLPATGRADDPDGERGRHDARLQAPAAERDPHVHVEPGASHGPTPSGAAASG